MISDATLSKSVHADTLGAWVMVRDERTVYDEWNPVAQIDAAGQVVQRHLWGTDLSGTPQGAGGVGGLLGTWDNGATTRDGSAPGDGAARVWVCAYDGNGNVSAAIAATVAGGGGSGNGGGAGTVRVARYDYDAFGKTLATWGDGAVAEANRYRFSTKPEDGTGLLYYGYRYLDTRLGRWVSRDPIGERGGVNLSGFVRNRPSFDVDNLGLTELKVEKCSLLLIIGHLGKNDVEWDIPKCAYGGAIGCFPGSNNPDHLDRGHWPGIPMHNDVMGAMDGSNPDFDNDWREKKNNEAIDPTDTSETEIPSEREHGVPQALDDATDDEKIKSMVEDLCEKKCCEEVTFILRILSKGKDGQIYDGIKRHSKKWGNTIKAPFYGDYEFKKTFRCGDLITLP